MQIPEKTKIGEYLVADDLAGVIGLVQMGIVEIHTWNSTAEDVERPNRIAWDLDPGQIVGWPAIVAAAHRLRDVLNVINRTNTSIVAFSTRARTGAPVSVPIAWSELTSRLDPAAFTVQTLPTPLSAPAPRSVDSYWGIRQGVTRRALTAMAQL